MAYVLYQISSSFREVVDVPPTIAHLGIIAPPIDHDNVVSRGEGLGGRNGVLRVPGNAGPSSSHNFRVRKRQSLFLYSFPGRREGVRKSASLYLSNNIHMFINRKTARILDPPQVVTDCVYFG